MERFAKIVNRYKPLNIFAKRSILDVRQGSEYASAIIHEFPLFDCGYLSVINIDSFLKEK